MRASRRILQDLSRSTHLSSNLRGVRSFSSQVSTRQLRASPFPSHLRPFRPFPFLIPSSTRFNSTTPSVPTVQDPSSESEPFSQLPKEQQAAYELTFTCKPCNTRSTHRVSKHGYHKGTVLITCQNCKNRHVIADHLKVFMDKRMTLEDILKEKGAMLKKGHLGLGGDVEFWDDGTKTQRGEGAVGEKNS